MATISNLFDNLTGALLDRALPALAPLPAPVVQPLGRHRRRDRAVAARRRTCANLPHHPDPRGHGERQRRRHLAVAGPDRPGAGRPLQLRAARKPGPLPDAQRRTHRARMGTPSGRSSPARPAWVSGPRRGRSANGDAGCSSPAQISRPPSLPPCPRRDRLNTSTSVGFSTWTNSPTGARACSPGPGSTTRRAPLGRK